MTAAIELHDVTAENWRACADLRELQVDEARGVVR